MGMVLGFNFGTVRKTSAPAAGECTGAGAYPLNLDAHALGIVVMCVDLRVNVGPVGIAAKASAIAALV